MRTKEQIQFQKKHEIESREAYESILHKAKDPSYLMQRIDLQNSRIELLDWVLQEGDFK